jgi:microcystin-dependent protein
MTSFLGDDAQFHALGSGDVGGLVMMPIGGTMIWWASSLPGSPGTWAWLNGQAISRTTYATLFSLIGTTFGAGDGSTTFNLPDVRGRAVFGQDNMGGASAANRITVAGGNFDGTVLGGAGGAQNHTLSSGEIPAHTHTATSTQASHSHSITPAAALIDTGSALSGTAAAGSDKGKESSLTTDSQAPAITTTVNANTGGGNAHTIMPPAIIGGLAMRIL